MIRCGGGRLMAGVRERNASAWLLPNDGTRTNHRLRDDMRRFADTDEVDLAVVGCGAGGSDAAAAAGARGLAGGRPGRRARSGTPTPTGSATRPARITCTGPSRGSSRRRSGPAWLQQLRPRSGRLDGALRRLHAPLPPERLRDLSRDGVGADWPISYQDLKPYYEAVEEELPVAGERVAVGRPALLPAPAASCGRQRRDLPARRAEARESTPRSGRSPSPTAGSATGRTASTAGSACRAARSTRRLRR